MTPRAEMRTPFQTIGARFPADVCAALERDARRLGLKPSEWMRMAVAEGLKARFSKTTAKAYRRGPTRAELRAAAREGRNGNASRRASAS